MVQMYSSTVATLLVALSVSDGIDAFHLAQSPCKTSTSLNALSRRDVLSVMPATVVAAASVFAFPQQATAKNPAKDKEAAALAAAVEKKKAVTATPLSFQGVWADRNHPNGYRVFTIGDKSKATMQLQDEPEGIFSKIYTIPIKVKTDKKTNEIKLTIDFSAKGGPKDFPGVLGSNKGVTTLTFPDGNVWKKETGMFGVYADGFNPKFTRVIRKDKGSKLMVDLINGPKTVSVSAKAGSTSASFDFPGKPNDKGIFDARKNTFTFADGNVWTKY